MCWNKRLVKDYETEVKIVISELGDEPEDPIPWRTWCINQHLPLVMSLAKKFYPQAPVHIAFLDIVQEGNTGLMEEVNQFLRTGKQGDFHPATRIQEQIKDFLDRESDKAPQPQPSLFT